MIKKFSKITQQKILESCNDSFEILKWLIPYQNCALYRFQKSSHCGIPKNISDSCKNIMDNCSTNSHILSNSAYLDLIYGDIMKVLSTRIEEKIASDDDILLFIYIILTDAHPLPTTEKMINGNPLNTIIWNAAKKWDLSYTYKKITHRQYENVVMKFAKDRYRDFNDKYSDGLYIALVRKFIDNSYQELIQKISDDSRIMPMDDTFHGAYQKKIQDIADDIYNVLRENISDTKNIIRYFDQDKHKELIKESVEKKYEKILRSYKDEKAIYLLETFLDDVYEKLNMRFPCDEYEELIYNIADDIFIKMIGRFSNNECEKITRDDYERICKKMAEHVSREKFDELFHIFNKNTYRSLRLDDYDGDEKNNKAIQIFVEDIYNVLKTKFTFDEYEKAIKNITDDVCKKLSENITEDRRFIGRHIKNLSVELIEDITNDKYDELVHIYVHEKHEDLANTFFNDIYSELMQKFADDVYDPFFQEFTDDRYAEFIKKIADNKYYRFMGVKFCNKYNEFAEYMIYVLYMWLADHGALVEYNSKIKTDPADEETVFDPNTVYEDTVKLWDECKGFPSRYNYYHYKSSNKTSRNHKNLRDHFAGILSGMKKSARTFLPSFITLIINELDPKQHNRSYAHDICDFPYNQYMPDLGYTANDIRSLGSEDTSILLKQIIAYENFDYGDRKHHDVELWFEEKKKELEEHCSGYQVDGYIDSLNQKKQISKEQRLKEQRLFKGLWATSEKEPDLYLSYFDIFLHIYRMRETSELIKHLKCQMDLTLSLLHLNVFTRWYDSLLLIEGMPFKFIKYNSVYLKLLTIPFVRFEDYQFWDVIKDLIEISDKDLEQALMSKDIKIKSEYILSLFYQRSRKKLCDDNLSNIFDRSKNSIKRKLIKDINPIYKLIYLFDNPDLDYKYLYDLLYTGYDKHIDKYGYKFTNVYGESSYLSRSIIDPQIKDEDPVTPEYEDGYN